MVEVEAMAAAMGKSAYMKRGLVACVCVCVCAIVSVRERARVLVAFFDE